MFTDRYSLRLPWHTVGLFLVVIIASANVHAELTNEEIAIDAAIQKTWAQFLERLSNNDASGAAEFIRPKIRKQYLQIFESMGDQLHEMAEEWSTIKAVQLSSPFSEYTIFTGTGSDERMHFISFARKNDGSWIIYSM